MVYSGANLPLKVKFEIKFFEIFIDLDHKRKLKIAETIYAGVMGWMMGLEPTTTGVTIRGSTTELHPPQPELCRKLPALAAFSYKSKNWKRKYCHWGG